MRVLVNVPPGQTIKFFSHRHDTTRLRLCDRETSPALLFILNECRHMRISQFHSSNKIKYKIKFTKIELKTQRPYFHPFFYLTPTTPTIHLIPFYHFFKLIIKTSLLNALWNEFQLILIRGRLILMGCDDWRGFYRCMLVMLKNESGKGHGNGDKTNGIQD